MRHLIMQFQFILQSIAMTKNPYITVVFISALLVTAIYDSVFGLKEGSIGDAAFGAGCGFLALGFILYPVARTEGSTKATPFSRSALRTMSFICAGVLILGGIAKKWML